MSGMSRKNGTEAADAPKLTVPQIIEYCKDTLGIAFAIMDETEAAEFLKAHNYFFRLRLYAENWTERTKGGKYVGLDFAHLVELSTIDMFLRKHILKMVIDLEHYLKVALVNECQSNPADDGYEVVEAYLREHERVADKIRKCTYYSEYGGAKFERHRAHPAVWNLVEMIGFNDLIGFYGFYHDFLRLPCKSAGRLESVRRLRNACAHNACIISRLHPVANARYDIDMVFELLQANLGMDRNVISSSLKVPVLNDFAVMLDVYMKTVSSPKIKEKTIDELREFFDGRAIRHGEYFSQNAAIKNAYSFARHLLEWKAGKK